MPRPRPLNALCAAPLGIGGPAWGFSDCTFFTVSSTLNIKHAASVAAAIEFVFTITGSQTNASKLSVTDSLLISTPHQVAPKGHQMDSLHRYYYQYYSC